MRALSCALTAMGLDLPPWRSLPLKQSLSPLVDELSVRAMFDGVAAAMIDGCGDRER